MDESMRQTIRTEIATLEADNRHMKYEISSKRSLLADYPADRRRGLENEIAGLERLVSGNEQKIRDFQRRL